MVEDSRRGVGSVQLPSMDRRKATLQGDLADLLKLGLGIVQVRSLHYLGELSVQTHTEVQHATVNLDHGRGWVTSESNTVDLYHAFLDQGGRLIEVGPVLDLLL